jgi:hypothetical protein
MILNNINTYIIIGLVAVQSTECILLNIITGLEKNEYLSKKL